MCVRKDWSARTLLRHVLMPSSIPRTCLAVLKDGVSRAKRRALDCSHAILFFCYFYFGCRRVVTESMVHSLRG